LFGGAPDTEAITRLTASARNGDEV
jgi:hypothetical protein